MFAHARSIVTLFGINVRIDPSWILIAALVTWSLAHHSFPAALPGHSEWFYAGLAVLAAFLFFTSLICHEFAHAITARRFGVETRHITLFLFGGVAELAREPSKAGHEFWIALAGPAMSLALSLGFRGLEAGAEVWSGQGPMATLFAYLALVNLILAVFNLIPAFPLDGGRVLRAWLWMRSGNMLQATERAAHTGTVLGYALIALGLLGLFQGATVAGLWQILIGLFVIAAAKSSVEAQRTRAAFGNRTVTAIMSSPAITVGRDETLASVVNQVMLPERVSFVPVVESGEVLGYLDADIVNRVDQEQWAGTAVGDVFVRRDPTICIPPDMPVLDLLERMSATGTRKFIVVQGSLLSGVVTLSDLTRQLGLLVRLGKQVHTGAAEART